MPGKVRRKMAEEQIHYGMAFRAALDRCLDTLEPMTLLFVNLPIEELLVLDEISIRYPGLMFNLRKQRQGYLLTILPSKHLTEPEVKGEP